MGYIYPFVPLKNLLYDAYEMKVINRFTHYFKNPSFSFDFFFFFAAFLLGLRQL